MREHADVAEDETAVVPHVGVVVVNYFGADRTIRCLRSLAACTWPDDRLHVVLVDNGSDVVFPPEVQRLFPAVQYLPTTGNLGFGGACNRGFAALGDCQYIALLNNDATAEPGWIEPLVEEMQRYPEVGAVTPKVVLDGTFFAIELSSTTARPGGVDNRSLGVQFCGVRVGGSDVSADVKLVEGFWGWEHDAVTVGGPFAWTSGRGSVVVPLARSKADNALVEVRLACGAGPVTATVRCGLEPISVDVAIQPAWFSVGTVASSFALINNAGTELHADGSAGDRGYLQPDDGRFDRPEEIFGWSGAAVLLRHTYLDEVGDFAAPFFLYYEDTDLSWRGRLAGWTYRYVPTSCVRHEHSATVGERSRIAHHLSERNRLTMLVRVAPRRMVRAATIDLVRKLSGALGRDVVGRVVRLRKPEPAHALDLGRVLLAFLRTVPQASRARRRIRSRARVADSMIVQRWTGRPPGT